MDTEKELALRLAWYIDRYGDIPETQLTKLWRAATLGQKDQDSVRLLALADEILEYFRAQSSFRRPS